MTNSVGAAWRKPADGSVWYKPENLLPNWNVWVWAIIQEGWDRDNQPSIRTEKLRVLKFGPGFFSWLREDDSTVPEERIIAWRYPYPETS